jgi:hypothetical protein
VDLTRTASLKGWNTLGGKEKDQTPLAEANGYEEIIKKNFTVSL